MASAPTEGFIIEAANRAVVQYGYCPNRVWAVASSHTEREHILPQLFPETSHNGEGPEAPNNQQISLYNDLGVHRGCTFDFCEQSQMNFTSVSQRHESPSCKAKPCGRIEGRFNAAVLADAAMNGEATAWQLYGVKLVRPHQTYVAISHVWSDGTGTGTWPAGEVNICLFHFFASIARLHECDGICKKPLSIISIHWSDSDLVLRPAITFLTHRKTFRIQQDRLLRDSRSTPSDPCCVCQDVC